MKSISTSVLFLLFAAGILYAEDGFPSSSLAIYQPVSQQIALESDVKKIDANAIIVRAKDYKEENGRYIIQPSAGVDAAEIWLEKTGDWIEPVSTPDPDDIPSISPQQIKIVELKGKAQVLFPEKSTPVRAKNGLVLTDGSVVKTDANSTVAVFFGGVNSIRLAPQTEVEINQVLTSGKRKTIVDLHTGFIFSKVGKRAGEVQDFKVRTTLGVASAVGTDFVTVKLADRMDVWIAEGKVELASPDGQKIAEAAADPSNPLQIIRTPAVSDPAASVTADSETIGAAINLIPQINVKLNVIREKQKKGRRLSPLEVTYLGRLHTISWLVKAQKYVPAPPPPPEPPHALIPVPASPEPINAPVSTEPPTVP